VTGAATANFVYDGDGKQIKATVNGVTAVYVGQHYEVKNGTVTKYYFAGSTRLAVRTGTALSYLLSDHIGSSSVTTDANGMTVGESLYKAFGETRYTLGNLNTDYKFTGQREESALGIYFFQSRWYDGSLGRFLSPDSIIPPGTQGYDRYAYTYNNPLRYNDPTGHCPWCVAALVGGLVSAGINYGMQVAANVYAGQDLSTAATNVDGRSIAISFVGGAIAGATMGAVNPVLANVLVSETLAAGVSGAIAGVAGGQAEALADASISQISDMTSGESFDGTARCE
jgi:RHS repeat-associated protein